mmetsp:Transcript_101256/g.253833  ORF Transcript_101256/g.253833 Transcript_101256/m.253833 type:complete len:370 (+) Transcript_101256:85-1194(+)
MGPPVVQLVPRRSVSDSLGSVLALGCAVGLGFGAGLCAGAALLLKWVSSGAATQGQLQPEPQLTSVLAFAWRTLLASATQCSAPKPLDARQATPPKKQEPEPIEGAIAPPPATHYVLRPWADPRVDQAIYVRYDPKPSKKTGAIIIVIPGGNYDESAVFCGEGQPVAQWLAGLGITAVVLQYRCVSEGHYWPAQYEDWADCARAVVGQAASWGCDPHRVGVIGFSAGGHLATYAALKAPTAELAPKLQILVYPSIDTLTPHEDGDIDPWYAEKGYPPQETSGHLLVGRTAPPAFLAGIIGDKYCPAKENTDIYAQALKEHGVPYEYVTSEEDEHGCGLQEWWTAPCAAWLVEQGWASAAPDTETFVVVP